MFSFYKQGSELNTAYPTINQPMQSSLGYKTNNVYTDFPPLMSDGRSLVASWQPENIINDEMVKASGINNNLIYRQFLQYSAKDIMTYNFQEACNDVGYYKRFAESPSSSDFQSRPSYFTSLLENKQAMGIEDTDLRRNYLSREQLNSQKITPFVDGIHESALRNHLSQQNRISSA